MARYVAVIHTWFMESKGFELHELEAKDFNSAELEARRLTEKGQDAFNSRAFKLIEIAETECVAEQNLNWIQRFMNCLSKAH